MSKYIRFGLISFAFVFTLSYFLNVSIASDSTKHYEAGLEQYKKGWYDPAIREFQKAIELKQDYVDAHYALGNSYYCKHLYDKAVKEYHKVLRYDPDHLKSHYALWLSYRALGMTGDADRELEIYKKLSSGEESKQEDASYTSSYSEKKDYTKASERTTSWHVSESQTSAEAKTPPKSTSHTETKKHETHSPPQKHKEEAVKKPGETLSYSEMIAQFEQKQKESTHTTPAAHAPSHEQPAKAKETVDTHKHPEAHAVETHKQADAHTADTHKQAETHDTHTSQPVTHKQPSAHVTAKAKIEEKTVSHAVPTHAKAEEHDHAAHTASTHTGAAEHAQASPSHHPVQEGKPKIEVHVSESTGQEPVKIERHRFAVEKPRWHATSPGIKAKVEHVWKYVPMGKVIISTILYVFAAQIWIGIVAMLGLFFYKRK